MMRSLYSGVSGMRTHQVKMDVIGNNIANVNTLSYKSSSITFGELMYQTTQRASGPNALTGTAGINAKQIGLGSQAGAINTNIAQAGASQTTGNPFDIKLNGDSFFVVSDGRSNYFTRAGAFYVDGGGNLAMTSNGYNVMGWGVDPETGKIKPDTVQPLKIMSPENLTYGAEATSKAYISGIIDKNDTDVSSSAGKIMNLKIYDNQGYSYIAKLAVKSIGDGSTGKYTVELNDIIDANNKSVMDKFPGITFGGPQNAEAILKAQVGATITGTNFTLKDGTTTHNFTDLIDGAPGTTPPPEFKEPAITDLAKTFGYDNTQNFLEQKVMHGAPAVSKTIGDVIKEGKFGELVDGTNNQLKFTERAITGAILEFDLGKGGFKGLNGTVGSTISLGLSGGGVNTNFSDVEVDFKLATTGNNGGSSTVAAKNGSPDSTNGSGRKMGKLSSISIQQNGMIYASYDNDMSKLLGQIAVAEFANASGLEKMGDNLYQSTLNSGDFDGIGLDVSANGGSMNTGALEMSNVDLSQEFAEMITTQRGFQANSRIITVSDTILEELVNLKR